MVSGNVAVPRAGLLFSTANLIFFRCLPRHKLLISTARDDVSSATFSAQASGLVSSLY